MTSSVEGWMVSPRKSRRKSACFSSTNTSTAARAKSRPSIIPAGPPPAMQQRVERIFIARPPVDRHGNDSSKATLCELVEQGGLESQTDCCPVIQQVWELHHGQ